ncbi:hypothetical protein DIJ60_19875 [Burkholderia pseudomallei]|nr:hypothetical protein DIJ60_19875 [Burkholderia pseudomallei]
MCTAGSLSTTSSGRAVGRYSRSSAIGYRLSAIGYRLSAIGYRLSAAPSAAGRFDVVPDAGRRPRASRRTS